MMLAAGEVVLTATGRKTTPFPKIDASSDRKAGNTVKRVDQWLMQNALAEARARGDEFNARQFEANADKPSQSDKDSAEFYLFDQDFVQPVQPSILKPLIPSPFAKNTIFTADRVEAARARMREKFRGQISSGIDPELLADGLTIAGAYVEAGVRDFAEFSAKMVDDFGEAIRPYLPAFWNGVRSWPGLDTSGMTDAVVAPPAAPAAPPSARRRRSPQQAHRRRSIWGRPRNRTCRSSAG